LYPSEALWPNFKTHNHAYFYHLNYKHLCSDGDKNNTKQPYHYLFLFVYNSLNHTKGT